MARKTKAASQAPGDPPTPTASPEPPADEQGDASGPDSNATPTRTPAHGQPTQAQQPASSAAVIASSPANPQDKHTQASTSSATAATSSATGNVPQPSSASDFDAPFARVRDRLLEHPERERILETARDMRASKALSKMTAESRERLIWGQL